MDIEKLIERLRNNNIENNCHDCALGYYAFEAAATLSTLQAENKKLRAELEKLKRERDAAIRDLRYLGDCVTCKYNKAPCPREDIGHKSCFQWRGQKED